MFLYLLAAIIGFILGVLYHSSKPSPFDTQIMNQLKKGKRVIICVDTESTIFELIGNKIRITRGYADFNSEPVNDNILDLVRPTEPTMPTNELPPSVE